MDALPGRLHESALFPSHLLSTTPPADGRAATVTVVTRTKDRPVLLHRAIASVLGQQYRHWEMVIVNDGGDPDVVQAVADEYALPAEGRIRVLHNERSRGMEGASNRALAESQGDYVVIHDDDDSWHPEFLATTIDFLERAESRPYVGVVTNCRVVHERIVDGTVIEDSISDWGFFRPLVELQHMIVENSFPPICFVFRRALLERIGAYCSDLPVLGDWEFNIRALTAGDIATIDRPLAYYHHRVSGAPSGYGNSVTAGASRHQQYNVLLRNSILRRAAQQDPAVLGIVQPLLYRLASMEKTLAHIQWEVQGLRSFSAEVSMVTSWQKKALRPLRAIWLRMLPLRKRIARLRGRAPQDAP